MDYDESRNSLFVHGINGRDDAAVIAPIRVWEDYALVIFDEESERDVKHPRGGETGGD